MDEILLSVEKLKKYFPVARGLGLRRVNSWIRAVDDISFSIRSGETFALVGETGCGKTTTAKLILLLEKPTSGGILFQKKDIGRFTGRLLKEYRSGVQAVFQDPYSSLNPRMRVGTIVAEPLVVNTTLSRYQIKEKVGEVLGQVGMNTRHAELYPHEFSGGQRQRISLARALVLKPRIIVLDEPVAALDVSIRAQIMNLLKELQEQLGVAYLFIAHHLGTVRYMSHRVGVMYLGQIVEMAPSEELFSCPLHPYTQALLSAALPAHPDKLSKQIVLSGEVPSAINIPTGCRFHPRCFRAVETCAEAEPSLREIGGEHWVACDRFSG